MVGNQLKGAANSTLSAAAMYSESENVKHEYYKELNLKQ